MLGSNSNCNPHTTPFMPTLCLAELLPKEVPYDITPTFSILKKTEDLINLDSLELSWCTSDEHCVEMIIQKASGDVFNNALPHIGYV